MAIVFYIARVEFMNERDADHYEKLAACFTGQLQSEEMTGRQLQEFAMASHEIWVRSFKRVIAIFKTIGSRFEGERESAGNYLRAMQFFNDQYIYAVTAQTVDAPPINIEVETLDAVIAERPFLSYIALTTEIQGWLHRVADSSGSTFNLSIGAGDKVSIVRTNYLTFRNSFYEIKINKYNQLVSEANALESKLSDLNQTYSETLDTQSTQYAQKIDGMADEAALKWGERFEAFRAAKDEENRIKKPVDLWSKAAIRHRRSFKVSIFILISAIGICAVTVYLGIGPLMKNIGLVSPSGDKAESFTPASTLTLAVLIALITAAGFVLKIFGRIVTNSLTLAEDAEIRAALADTYLGLTAEEEGATSESRDKARTVMLAALFRPLPGHQQEEVVAPTVLSLAQDMLSKKGPTAPS